MGATSSDRAEQPKAGAAGAEVPVRARLSAAERRDQLTEIGLELLQTRPIHELALDEVAEHAGISRTLLFHYFPSKSDFYAAVVERAGQRLLGARRATPGASGLDACRQLIDGYLRLVEGSRDLYVRLVRGAAGGDPAVMATIDELRTSLIPAWLEAVGLAPEDADEVTRLMVRGWLVGMEEVALAWDPVEVPRAELTDALARAYLALVATRAAGMDTRVRKPAPVL